MNHIWKDMKQETVKDPNETCRRGQYKKQWLKKLLPIPRDSWLGHCC